MASLVAFAMKSATDLLSLSECQALSIFTLTGPDSFIQG